MYSRRWMCISASMLWCLHLAGRVDSFCIPHSRRRPFQTLCTPRIAPHRDTAATTTTTTTITSSSSSPTSKVLKTPLLQAKSADSESDSNSLEVEEDVDIDDDDYEILFEEPEEPLDAMERTWRYAKKPLLRIGSKGATLTHGNSLRQLLETHTVVKVKVNTRRFNDSLESAFEHLRRLAEDSGAPKGIELIQARESDHIILFGMPGTLEKIKNNQFPPQ